MYLGSHAQDSTRNTSIPYNGGPGEPIFKCFLIWVSTSRHQGLFFQWHRIFTNPKQFLWLWTFELQDNNFPVLFTQHISAFVYSVWFCLGEVKGYGVRCYRRWVWMKKSSVASPGLYTSNTYSLLAGTGLQKIRPDYPVFPFQSLVHKGNLQFCLFNYQDYGVRSDSYYLHTKYQ